MKKIILTLTLVLIIQTVSKSNELLTDVELIEPSQITNIWLKDKTVTELYHSGFRFLNKSQSVTATDNNTQYHLYKKFTNPYKLVYVICFIVPNKTSCFIV